MNVKFNGGGTLIFPNTFVDLPNGMLNWEWGPSTLQRLGKAQALRVYECALLDLVSPIFGSRLVSLVSDSFFLMFVQ